MKKVSDYFTGGELIDGLGILAIDLVKAIRAQLVPYPISEIDGQFRTPETDPLFYSPDLAESATAWLDYVRAAMFFKPFVQTSMPRIMADLGTCWEAEPLQMGGVITGREILSRWKAAPFKLADAIRAGLVPIDTARGTRRTPDVDPCLVCRGGKTLNTCNGCQREIIDRIVNGKQEITENRHCRLIGDDGLFETGFREYVERATFLLSEVEGYEKAHGLKQSDEERPKRNKKQVTQDIKAARQESFDRLLEKALAYAEEFISQDRRMRKDIDLYPYLCANSNGEEVSHETKKAIWNKLPAAAKKGPGAPKKTE